MRSESPSWPRCWRSGGSRTEARGVLEDRAVSMSEGGRLQGEVALVTGSTAGLGAAIARRFVEAGASVLLTGRSEARGEQLLAELREAPGRSAFLAVDLGEEGGATHLVDYAVEKFGALTVLVNNAVASDALVGDTKLADLSSATWEAVLLSSSRLTARPVDETECLRQNNKP